MGGLLTGVGGIAVIVGVVLIVLASKNHKPKKMAIIVLCAGFVVGVAGSALSPSTPNVDGGSAQVTDEPTTEQTTVPSEEPTAEPTAEPQKTPEEEIREYTESYIAEYYTNTDVDEIRVNEDGGTDADGDYILLVDLTWNQKNSGPMSKEVLSMYSEDMAARVGEDLPSVTEVAVFWDVPYLDANCKVSYERSGDGMVLSDSMFGQKFE